MWNQSKLNKGSSVYSFDSKVGKKADKIKSP